MMLALRCLSVVAIVAVCSGCNTEKSRSNAAACCYADAVDEIKVIVNTSTRMFSGDEFLAKSVYDRYSAKQLALINTSDPGNERSKAVMTAFEKDIEKVRAYNDALWAAVLKETEYVSLLMEANQNQAESNDLRQAKAQLELNGLKAASMSSALDVLQRHYAKALRVINKRGAFREVFK